MGKLRKRLDSRKNAKRWLRGQSSSSNPSFKEYRDRVRTGLFHHHSRPSGLTINAVKSHNAVQQEVEMADDGATKSDEESGTDKTSDTFASDWSGCSNISFSRFLDNFQPSSLIHKDMLAILAAVSEVIKQENGVQSSTEYYSALITILEAADTEGTIVAALTLLEMGMKTVPKNTLNYHHDQATRIFSQILIKYVSEEHSLILRHCIGCLSILLKIQETAAWSTPSTEHILDAILSFATHTKPKLRRTSQRAIYAILKGSDIMKGTDAPDFHPAAPRVANFCLSQLKCANRPGQLSHTLHILNLLKDIAGQFPRPSLKLVCEGLLSAMTLNNVVLTSCCLRTLHSLMISRPTELVLPSQLNAQIIEALYDYQPAPGDIQLTLAWLAVMQEAYCNLVIHSPELCGANMLRMVATCTDLWLSDKTEIINGSSHVLRVILESCIPPLCESPELVQKSKPILKEFFHLIQQGMEYRFISSWHHVLHLLALVIKIIGVHCREELEVVLATLSELRDSYDFIYNAEVDFAIGAAVRTVGPEVVLLHIPLQATHESGINLKRSWLLPILRECITHSSLEFFICNLLPLADYCERESQKLRDDNNEIGAHSNVLLQIQIWSLLPSICNNTSDVKRNFKRIARRLGDILCEKKDLRIPVMASLRKLIQRSVQSGKEEDIEELSRFSKNYLPVLFNLYTTKPTGSDEEGQRLASYETIKIFLSIASGELIPDLLDKALENLSNDNESDFFRDSIFDLIRLLSQCVDLDRLQILSDRFVSLLKNIKRPKEQKKAYRFLEEICGSDKSICREYVRQNRQAIQSAILNSSECVQNISRGARIRCIVNLVKEDPNLGKSKFFDVIVPEAITCLKESNERCRISAFTLLYTIAEKLIDREDDFERYIRTLMGGLGGSPSTQCSSSILALTCITYHFNGYLEMARIHQILEQICSHLVQNTRDTVSSALSFIKVYLSVSPNTAVASKLSLIMEALMNMTDDCRQHFRQNVRDILVKLSRKFNIEALITMVPSSEQVMLKRLKNIQRIEQRKRKTKSCSRKSQGNDEANGEIIWKNKSRSIQNILADSDEDCDYFDHGEINKNLREKVNRRWIQENASNILNFVDPATTGNIATTKLVSNAHSNEKVPNKYGHGFRLAPDGRLIITDDVNTMEDSDKEERSLGRETHDSECCVGTDNDSRKVTPSQEEQNFISNVKDFAPNSQRSMAKCETSGSGIYRSLKNRKNRNAPGEEYRARNGLGDVRVGGKPDPYAYIPLTSSTLRKKRKGDIAASEKLLCQNKRGKKSRRNF